MSSRARRRCAAVLGVLALFVADGRAQRGRAPATPALPAISMTCPHHPDVIESAPGTCPFCKMALVPVRLAPAWSCPIHPATIADRSGTCPVCRRTLVPVTVSLTFTCAGSTAEHLERGTCPDGTAMAMRRTLRPHGDHNPRHGGQFFMAPDNWHHVEGTYPSDRIFRLYVYDDYARPLPLARLRAITGRVVTSERFDPVTRTTRELRSFPLRAARNGAYLEATLDTVPLPSDLTAKVKFAGDAGEHRFDFTFHTLTKEPAAPASTTRTRVAPPSSNGTAQAPSAPAPAPEPTAVSPDALEPDPALAQMPVPDTMDGILAQLRTRTGHVQQLIERGNGPAVWVPAFQVRDLALALEPHLEHIGPPQREAAAPAIQRVVRLAWLLDAQGDSGNRQALTTTYAAFSSAVTDLLAAFGQGPR
jgi:hypothetical protein